MDVVKCLYRLDLLRLAGIISSQQFRTARGQIDGDFESVCVFVVNNYFIRLKANL